MPSAPVGCLLSTCIQGVVPTQYAYTWDSLGSAGKFRNSFSHRLAFLHNSSYSVIAIVRDYGFVHVANLDKREGLSAPKKTKIEQILPSTIAPTTLHPAVQLQRLHIRHHMDHLLPTITRNKKQTAR